MKKLVLFLLFVPLICFTQVINEKKIDSLLQVLKYEQNDTSQVNIYHEICVEYQLKDVNKLIYYNDKLLALSQKINCEKGKAYYFYHLTSINGSLDKDRLKPAKSAAAIFFKIKNFEYYLLSCYDLAFGNMTNGDYAKAKEICNASIKFAARTTYYKSTGNFYRLLGLINYYDDALNKSLVYYKKAFYYYNKDKNCLKNISDLYLYIAYTHTDLLQYKEALHYLNLAKIGGDDVNINIEKAVVLNNLKEYEKALQTLMLNKFIKYNYNSIKDYNDYTLAQTYFYLKNYTKALQIAIKIPQRGKIKELILDYNNLIANCYLNLNNSKAAQKYNQVALALIDSTTYAEGRKEVLLSKSTIEKSLGNYKTALLYLEKYTNLKEQNDTKINADKVRDLQVEFDIAEKNNKIRNLQINKQEKLIQINTQKNYIILISLSLFLALLSVFFFVKKNQNTKRKNRLIAIKNDKLKRAQLLTQKSLTEKELLFKEIHHRVKNNMQLIMSLLKLQATDVKSKSVEDFIKISQSRINAMALIHENLYQPKIFTASIDFKNYIDNLINGIKQAYNSVKEIKIIHDVTENSIDIQTAIPLGLIVNEIINNAYKHAFATTENAIIKISFSKENDHYNLAIKDNGLGINEKQLKEKGLGLSLVKLLVSQINGKLIIDTKSGTSFLISF